MISILCAIICGITVVLSRSVNSYLSQKTDPYHSTFFNYFTGLLTSIIILFFTGTFYLNNLSSIHDPVMLLGGMIGVFNILILNIITDKLTPVQLTLITFIAQLTSGMFLDYYLFDIFTLKKLIGCLIVIIGLALYQLSDYKIR